MVWLTVPMAIAEEYMVGWRREAVTCWCLGASLPIVSLVKSPTTTTSIAWGNVMLLREWAKPTSKLCATL